MLGALVIVFREVIEAGLIIGIILAVTRGLRGSRWLVALGVAAGVLGACLVAAFVNVIASALAGMGQELFNASILILAVAMLIWHNVWMSSHGRELAREAKSVSAEVRAGTRSLFALAIVVAVAVMREGSEVALFLYGLSASAGSTKAQLLEGSALGIALGACVTAVTYFGLIAIPQKLLFRVTSLLIGFLAAGLASQAVVFLQQAGVVDIFSRTAWDTSGIVSGDSLFGRVLHALFGYADQPSQLQVIVYAFVLIGGFWLARAVKNVKTARA